MRSISLLFPAMLASLFVFPSVTAAQERTPPSTCSYEMQIWNVHQKTSVSRKKVRHAYADLVKSEIDPATGCTVCIEDQESITIPPVPTFFVCAKLASNVRSALESLAADNQPIKSISGYRVIMSRGPLDPSGNRTEFSNHSFGAAIDINPEQNGLYDNCIKFGPQCTLLRGGVWRPGTPGTLEANSPIVRMFKEKGFRWGGEIAGKQKDFMHFSLTGY